MFVILSWPPISLVYKNDGSGEVATFASLEEAAEYAKKNIPWDYDIIDLGE